MRLLAVVLALSCALFACTPASSPIDARGLARGAVVTMTDAWNVASTICLDQEVVGKLPDGTCAKNLLPARDAILAAADAVDTWDAAAQGNFACLIFAAFKDVDATRVLLTDLGVQVPQLVTDGLALAKAFVPQCKTP